MLLSVPARRVEITPSASGGRREPFRRRIRRWLLAVGIVLAFVVGTGSLVAWRISRQAPVWWRQVEPDRPETSLQAESVENGIVSAMHRADRPPGADSRPGAWRSEAWQFSITAADANAWLNTRLWKWLANQDERWVRPEGVREVQVDFDEGLIRIGVRVHREGGEQILSAAVRPRIEPSGLYVPAETIAVGRLVLPASLVLDRARVRLLELASPPREAVAHLDSVFESLAGHRALEVEPVVEVNGGRRVRILELTPRRGRLEVTCRTEHSVE